MNFPHQNVEEPKNIKAFLIRWFDKDEFITQAVLKQEACDET
jgi:hypothetical protein